MPDDPLRQWQEWQLPFANKPSVISKLDGGIVNHSYLIEAANQRWVLRINGSNTTPLGINRDHEAIILAQASRAGIAPEVLYCSPDQGVLITAFIEGQHWPQDAWHKPQNLSRLIDLLHAVHALDVTLPSFNYHQHVNRYWQELLASGMSLSTGLRQEHEQVMAKLDTFAENSSTNTICHHDIIAENIIERSGKIYLVDWEYAAFGRPAFDYATLSVDWRIPITQLGLTDQQQVFETELAIAIYQHICKLWGLLNKA